MWFDNILNSKLARTWPATRGFSKCSVQAEVSAMMAALGWRWATLFSEPAYSIKPRWHRVFQAYTIGYQL
jgi:hypothetical protein